MTQEEFQPIAVAPPSSNPLLFKARCWLDLQLSTIVMFLKPAMAGLRGKVLDVGAGESPWRDWLPTHCIYQGIDVEQSGEYGMSTGRQDIIYYAGRDMPLGDSSFDGAMCIEVLEHAEDPDRLLTEIARILKNGATLLLTVPFSARRHHVPHDFHRFTREQLVCMLERHGFVNIDIQERGNDICAIASKLIVLCIRLLKSMRLLNLVWVAALLAALFPITIGFLVAAHASIRYGLGSKEDPLGYFVHAVRRRNS